jgi:hypothetical protein
MDAAARHVNRLLAAAQAAGGALSFCVVIPGWLEAAAWGELTDSPFLKASIVVAAAEHGGCETWKRLL